MVPVLEAIWSKVTFALKEAIGVQLVHHCHSELKTILFHTKGIVFLMIKHQKCTDESFILVLFTIRIDFELEFEPI